MSQTAELSRVKARIKALTEKTVANGCTEAEAMAAAEMVGRLLERYALSMDEIEVRTARCVQAQVPLGSRRRRAIDGCVPAIARFCDCKVWLARGVPPDPDDPAFDRTSTGSRYVFFGFETDTALATYLFAVIDRAVIHGNLSVQAGQSPVPCGAPATGVGQLSAWVGGPGRRTTGGDASRPGSGRPCPALDRHGADPGQAPRGRRRVPGGGRPTCEHEHGRFPCDPKRLSRGLGRRRTGQPESPYAGRGPRLARLSGPRDRQRSRVYNWEDVTVAPVDPTTVPFRDAQAMVDAIWSDMGLRYPPAVEPLPRQARATVASANRLLIRLPEQTPSWCLLHELAHAMTSAADGRSDRHGPAFMGIYLRLLVRYLRLDPIELAHSIQVAGIAINPNARPAFLGT